jgi:nuclear pore complex protein Nup133
LYSPAAAEDVNVERDRNELERKFAVLRPEIFETLRELNCNRLYACCSHTTREIGRHGHAGAAFTLAEQYRDFSSLASLCHKETVYPPEDNPHALRIQAYFDRFKDEFAMELYRWYIQHGVFDPLSFATFPIHLNLRGAASYVCTRRSIPRVYGSILCFIEAEQATHLEAKHVSISLSSVKKSVSFLNHRFAMKFMLSVGKLSQLAQLHETNAQLDDSVLDGT